MRARMHRILRRPVSLAVSLLMAAGLLTASLTVVPAAPASAQATITICLTYASGYCADVKDSDNVAGQPIWLYHPGNDYHWLLVTGVTCVAGTNCYQFEDAQKPTLCLSTTVGRSIVLGTCNGGTGSWYPEGGGYYGNGGYGATYTLMVHTDTDGALLTALPSGTVGYWKRWTL